jgi:serine protease Do
MAVQGVLALNRVRAPQVRARFWHGLAGVLLAGAAVFGSAAPALAQTRDAPASFADLAEKLMPAVVNIATTQQQVQGRTRDMPQAPPGTPLEEFFREFFERGRPGGPQGRRATSLGSGFIVDASGYIVTNNHVIQGADEITVILQDDTQLKATLVGRDDQVDIAVLKVEPPNKKVLPTVKWADSDKTRVGDWVIAIGNPFGFGHSATAGIVSARARELSGRYDDYIQTDASINKGNSGGPLFNMDGEVVGVNTAIIAPSGGNVGIGFSIPANLARNIAEQLREFGRVRRGWIGVQIQQVTDDIAENFGLDKARGALIADVTAGGPAEKAQLRKGDIVLSFNGRDVVDSRKFPRIVAESRVNETVDAVVWRSGKRTSLKVRIGENQEAEKQNAALGPGGNSRKPPEQAQPQPSTIDQLGLTLSRISDQLRERYNLSDTARGVVVTRVGDGSVAAEKGMRAGDVIVEINQSEVASPADVQAKVKEAQQQKRRSVLLLVDRQGDQRFVALRIQN